MKMVIAFVLAACGSDSASIDAQPNNGDDGSVDVPGSMGCGAAGAPTGSADVMITVGGVERRYIRAVPASYDGSRPLSLIFAWHGRGSNGTQAQQYFGIEAAAGADAIVVYPFGLPVSATPSDTGWELTANGRDVALFDAIQKQITDQYCVGRTYSMGHSFGGYMSNTLACARGGTAPSAVRAIAPVAGGGPFGTCAGTPVSAIIIHGMTDAVVPFTQGQDSYNQWRTKAGCDATSQAITPSPCVANDGCDGGLVVRWCAHGETTFMGHGWPTFVAGAAWQLFRDSP
jgi:poly(3-hydroxybutyrate) depolymerase